MALTPSETVRAAWATVADAALWAGVNPELWKRVARELGDDSLTSMLLLGGVSDEDYRAAAGRL